VAEPDVNDVLRALAATSLTHVVVVPNGFVCDHGEVLYDLDVQATLGGAGTFESCEQWSNGAFGPGGTSVKTLLAVGTPAGSLLGGGPAPVTLVSLFAVPPNDNATVNAFYDLPGPGAVLHGGKARISAAPTPW
jgi:hypothetical protein